VPAPHRFFFILDDFIFVFLDILILARAWDSSVSLPNGNRETTFVLPCSLIPDKEIPKSRYEDLFGPEIILSTNRLPLYPCPPARIFHQLGGMPPVPVIISEPPPHVFPPAITFFMDHA